MNTLESLNTALLKVQREVPFNNFRRYLAADKLDKDLPSALGGACVYQLKKLAGELRGVEGEEVYVEEIGGGHAALIKNEPNTRNRYYLDPFLLHKAPVNLNTVLTVGPQVSEVYPTLLTRAQGTLEVRYSSGQNFSATVFHDPFNPNEYVSYLFNSAQTSTTPPPLTRQRLPTMRPNEFVLRLLNDDWSTTTLTWSTSQQTFKIKKKGGIHAHRTFMENSTEFDKEKVVLCAHVGLSWTDLKDTIRAAWNICKSLSEEERRVF